MGAVGKSNLKLPLSFIEIIGGIGYPRAMILEKLTWVSTERATSGSAALKRVVKAAVGVRIAKSPAW